MPIRELARAKVNLTLHVLGRRPDGYHELESLVTFADAARRGDPRAWDAPAASPSPGPFASYIAGENLLVRALALLRERRRQACSSAGRAGQEPAGCGRARRRLGRRGGGAAGRAAGQPRSRRRCRLDDIAARLGADVPVCLGGRPALMSGIGEKHGARRRACRRQRGTRQSARAAGDRRGVRALGAGPRRSRRHKPAARRRCRGWPDLVGFMRARGNDLERPAMRAAARDPRRQGGARGRAGVPLSRPCPAAGRPASASSPISGAGRAARRRAHRTAFTPDWWVKATVLHGQARRR